MRKLTVLVALAVLNAVVDASTCEIDLTKLSRYEPVFLIKADGQYEFKHPANGKITFNSGDEYFAICTNDDKKFRRNECKPGEKNDDACDRANSVTAKKLDNSCGPSGAASIYEIGIQIPTQTQFASLFSVCFDTQTRSVQYSSQKIRQASLQGTMKNYASFSTWNGFAYEDIKSSVESSYSIVYKDRKGNVSGQRKRFTEILGEARAKHFIPDDPNGSKLFLARGHLSANADQPFETWRKATYFYLNHVPQWQKLNQGVWLAVENHIRELTKYGSLNVMTGGHGVLEIDGHKISMVNGGLLPVPKYVWKAIIDEKSDDGIVFVTRNLPFQEASSFGDFCHDRMDYCKKEFGTKYSTIEGGFLTCCSLDEFKAKLTHDPFQTGSANKGMLKRMINEFFTVRPTAV